jgi:hypothetical protein
MAKKATAKKTKAKNPRSPGPPPPVPIRISAAGVVLDRVANVKTGQDVKWIAQDGGGPWTITFKTSPFSGNTYTVPRGGTVETTGGAKGRVRKRYPYSVMDQTGTITDEGAEIVVE